MGFEEMHRDWITSHLKRRSGERKHRLQRGHAHGERLFLERVWWPIFGHFEGLHPEYQIVDWRGQPYFVDFVWIQGTSKFAIEVKGFGPHVQNSDRIRYRRELNREMFIQSLGYRVVSIPYDEIEHNPQLIIFLLKSLLTPFLATSQDKEYSWMEREVLMLVMQSGYTIRPIDLVRKFEINKRTAANCLRRLCEKGRLKPIVSKKSGRVMRYELINPVSNLSYW